MALNSIRLYEITCDDCGTPFPGADGSQPDGAVYDTSREAIEDLGRSDWSSNVITVDNWQTTILNAVRCSKCRAEKSA